MIMRDDAPRIQHIDSIFYTYQPGSWPFAIEQSDAIDRHWEKRRAANPHLFNGEVFLMRSHAIESVSGRRVLRANAFKAEYKAFLAWRNFGFPGPDAADFFAMAALVSADGAFMLGRMNDHTASPGRIYFPAGTPDPVDLKGDVIDLDGSVFRELEEETGIHPDEVVAADGWSVVFEGPRIACMKILRSGVTAAEIVARFEAFAARQTRPELHSLAPVFSEQDLDEDRMPAFTVRYLRHAFAEREAEQAPL
jgi:8-oxo-dGTP pyrophosphatase MutT (NUDIX family)